MRLTPDSFTPKAKAAILAVLNRYGQFGTAKDKPEPEPLANAVPELETIPAEPAEAK